MTRKKDSLTDVAKLLAGLDAGQRAALLAALVGDGAIAQAQRAKAVGKGGTLVEGDAHFHAAPEQPGPKPTTLRQSYLQWVFDQAATLDLAAIDPKGKAEGSKGNAPLGALYTGLLTTELEAKEELRGEGPPERSGRRLSALAQLDVHRHLVLLGEAGSGKSTFVQWVTLCLAGAELMKPDANLEVLRRPIPEDRPRSRNRASLPQPWRREALLPVRVVLRRFAAKGLPPIGKSATADDLWTYIASALPAETLGEFVPQLKRHLMETGGLILLDGLDEVPEAGARRVQLKQAILDFASIFHRCRIVVTSRVYAYQDQDWVLPDWQVKVLHPFTHAQIRHYVELWYAQAAKSSLSKAEASRRAERLMNTIQSRPNLFQLASQPLLLALMTSLHNWEGGRLPDKREMLYHESVELLLYRWEASRPPEAEDHCAKPEPSLAQWLDADRSKVRSALERVAAEVHRSQADPRGTAEVLKKDIVDALMDSCPKARGREQDLVEYLRDRSGILIERDDKTFAFPHRTFQEYLAACQLANEGIPGELPDLLREDPNRWREVVLLAAARAFRGSEALLWSLVDALCVEGANEQVAATSDFWAAHLAAQAVTETADLNSVSPHRQPKIARLRRWLVAILETSHLPARERALASRHLAALGDSREHVTNLDAMEFCCVPKGPFLMGNGDGDEEGPDSVKEQHRCEIPYHFWMARFPVTIAQWREYASTLEVDVPQQGLEGDSNAPVVLVTWFQAQKFCAWLTERWKDLLPADSRVSLPSEAEWEKAARGGLEIPLEPLRVTMMEVANQGPLTTRSNEQKDRPYPWLGNLSPEHANYSGTQIGRSSSVGCFPLGTSTYGCEEMSGNVWEWTRSKGWTYPYPDPGDIRDAREEIDDSPALRVLRGGSFLDDSRRVRCAYRLWNRPYNRDANVGFRVVICPLSSGP